MGERDITASVQTEIAKTEVRPIYFVELDFLAGFTRVWTGIGDKTFESNTYSGTGLLGSIGAVQETIAIRANSIQLSLTGVPISSIALALGQTYQGRSCKVWLGFVTSANVTIADPLQIFGGRMDVMAIEDNGDTASIALTAESELAELQRARVRRYTDEDQHIIDSADDGFKYISGLQDKKIYWGTADPTSL